MTTMVKEVHVNTQHYSHDSMVSQHSSDIRYPTERSNTGGAMIIARSFARIHETNLKVRFSAYPLHGGFLTLGSRNKASCHCGSPTRRTTPKSVLVIPSRLSAWPTYSKAKISPQLPSGSRSVTDKHLTSSQDTPCLATSSNGCARAQH